MASIASHPVEIYVAATDSQLAGDLCVGLKEFTVKDSATVLDITDMADATGYKKRLTGLSDVSISLGGQYEQDDAPQALLRACASATVYCAIEPDGVNGYAYPCVVESYELKGEIDGLVEVSVSLVGNGAKVAKS